MNGLHLLRAFLHICAVLLVKGDCPTEFPIEVDAKCYRFQTDLMRNDDAKDVCRQLGGKMAALQTNEVPNAIVDKVIIYIVDKLSSGYFWIGFKTEDTSSSKPLEEREWLFDIDDSKVLQKKYEYWDEEPTQRPLTCAAVNGSRDFKVVAVDCGGPRIPVICMRNEGECKDDMKPYFNYGPYCLAAINGALEYNKIHGACHPDKPTPIKDEDMRNYVMLAAKNSFLGGALFVDFWKWPDEFRSDEGQVVPEGLWDEGEPKDGYECSGLGITADGSLKLKSLSCDFTAASLCETGAETDWRTKCFLICLPKILALCLVFSLLSCSCSSLTQPVDKATYGACFQIATKTFYSQRKMWFLLKIMSFHCGNPLMNYYHAHCGTYLKLQGSTALCSRNDICIKGVVSRLYN